MDRGDDEMLETGLSGKTAVVTAGAGSIGRAVCEAFAKSGARIAVCDRDAAAARSFAEALRAFGAVAEGFEVNPGRRAELAGACDAIIGRFGRIDVLINNENAILRSEERVPLHEFDMRRCDEIITEGIKGFFMFSQCCMRDMALRKNGSVVNITSIRGLVPVACQVPVVAVSAAVIGMTKMWGVELKNERIRVNAVAAGITDDELELTSKTPEDKGLRLSHLAIQRPAKLEELAAATLFLASDAASYITGAVLPVDGGLSAGYVRSF